MVHNFVVHKLVYQCFFVYFCKQNNKTSWYDGKKQKGARPD